MLVWRDEGTCTSIAVARKGVTAVAGFFEAKLFTQVS